MALGELNLRCAAPATLAETVALKMMITVPADAEELASLHLAHRRVVNLYGIRYYALLGQRHFSQRRLRKANGLNSML